MAAADDTTPGITEENGGEEGRPVAFTPIKHDDEWRRTTAWVAPPEYPPGFVPVDEDPAATVPLGKRLISKQWKERTIAYTELGNQVSGATANDLHTLTEYIELLPKMAGDINACAKAKGLLTCQAFVDRVTIPGELAGTLAKTVVSDAFKGNPRMLSDATEIIMKLIERGHGNVVFDELLAGLENKLPKITTACVQSILTAVEEFGCKAVPVRAIDDRVPSMLNHLNDTCRATAMKLCSAMYTYRGVEFRDAIGRMEIRSAQEKDLNALFDSITVKSHTPARTVRRADGSIPQPSGLSISAPNTDRSVLDIMVKLPSSWIDEMRSDKWKDRKAAIDTLVSITSSRGQMKWSHEVADVVDAVRTQLSDNNIMVAGQAIAAFSNLAAGLPSAQFLPLALPMFPQVIQALKEKKHMVIGPALSFLDTFTDKTLGHDLSPVLDDLVAGLGHKTPKVAADLLQWLSSALPKLAPSCIKKNFIAALGTAISNNLDHSAGDVRANALGALAALLAVSGESDPFFSRFLPEFESRDSTRCRKIRDLAVEIASSIPARDPAPRAGDSQTKRTPKRNSAPAVVEQRDTDDKGSDFAASSPTRGQGPKAMVFETGTTQPKQPASRPMAFEIDATTPKKHASRPKLPKRLQRSPPLPALRSKPPVDETPALPPSSVPGEPSSSPAVESGNSGSSATSVHRTVNPVPVNDTALPALAFEEASALLAEKMTPEVVVQLSSKNWKERVAAMEFINSRIDEEGFGVTDLCQPLLYTINKTPGWKEVNFQVNALMFEMVAKLASVSTAFSTRLASPPLVALLNKLGDPKLNATALDCCLALCEALGPAAIVPMILSKSASVKNPKALQGVVTALRTILIDFGASTMALKGIVDASKTWLAHSSAGVRTETTSLLLEMYKQVGSPPMRSAILDGLKPALAKVVEADIDAITPGSGILTPTRFKRGTLPDSSSSKAKNSKGNSGFVLERADISSKITGKLLQQMDCDAWKERKAALDTVSSILEAAHHHIQPNVRDLVKAVLARVSDANKLLVLTALGVLRTLGDDLGPSGITRHAKAVVASVHTLVADSKKQIAGLARDALLAWIQGSALQSAIPAIIKGFDSQLLREGLLDVLLRRLSASPGDLGESSASQMVPAVLSCVQDKIVGVRALAEKLLSFLAGIVGLPAIRSCAQSLPRTAQMTVMPCLDKLGNQDLPAVQPSVSCSPAMPSGPTKGSTHSGVSHTAAPRKALSRTLRKRKPGAADSGPKRVKRSRSVEPVPGSHPQPVADSDDIRVCDGKAIQSRRDSRWRQNNVGYQEWTAEDQAHLSELILPWVSASLHQDMFSVDFQKHVVAFDTISQAAPCAFASVRDLLLAWTSLRIAEDKTQVVVKALEFCSSTLSSCAGLDEYDANCIVPVLVEKLLGHNKAPLRTRARELLKLSADAWSPSLVGKFLFDGIMVSKNSRVKSSCMDELVALSVKNGGVDGVVPRKALQVVAEFVTSHDSSMRNAAISLLQRAYNDLGDSVFWSRLGSDLPDKVRKVMEKQFKRPPAAPQSPRIGRPKSSEGTSAVPAPTSLTSVARAADPPSKASIQHADDDDMFRLDLEEVGIAGTPRDTQGAAAERKAESSAPSDAVPTALRVPSTNRLQPHIFGDEPTSDDSAAVNKLINDLEFGIDDTKLEAMKMVHKRIVLNAGLDMPIAKEVNKLVTLLLQQIRSAIGPRGNQRLLSPAIDALASILKAHGDCHDLALGVSIDTLQFFYEVVLSAMLDKRLEGPHSKSSIAMLNILVLKSLETTDRSRCFAALIRSLTDLWSHTVVVDRGLLCTLICRCIVKLIKTLDKTHERLKLQMLLGEVHDFLERHPQSFWEARSDQIGVQKPWNTVFTLVVKLVELRGASILQDIVGVPKGALLREIINERLPAASKAPSAPVQGSDDTSLRAPVIEGVHRLSLSDGRSPAVPDTKGAFSRSSDRADLEPYLANVESRIRARSEPAAAENASGAQGGSTTSRVLSYQERFRLLRSRTQGSSSSEPRLAAGSPTKSISSIPSTSAPPGVDTSLAMLRNRVNLAPPAAVTNDAKENGSGAPSNVARSAPAPPDHKPAAPSSLPPSTTTPSLSTLRARIEELKRKT